MFQISTGDAWHSEVLQPLLEKQGLVESEESTAPYTSEMIGTIIFMVSYILTVMIVLVNVAVAVLLEGFLSSIAEHDTQKRVDDGIDAYSKNSGDLDSLLAILSTFRSEVRFFTFIWSRAPFPSIQSITR